ncbi:hypothetical protein [Nocardia cyriacigeorgica]|uniref:hypothetical protein n=1 Tax=Nocardia cyriacigeorgica TaxID=135487 RepID=UPI002456FF08|nr:hypothetical protein [Nocardia cyriacigeorgica]
MSMPRPSDFRTPREHLVQFLDDGPDRRGRRQFAGYWIDHDRVRGQVWHTDPITWTTRTEREGGTVRILEETR